MGSGVKNSFLTIFCLLLSGKEKGGGRGTSHLQLLGICRTGEPQKWWKEINAEGFWKPRARSVEENTENCWVLVYKEEFKDGTRLLRPWVIRERFAGSS